MLVENKTALVTGGSRGIGRAIVTRLAREGASVAFTYRRSKEQADELVASLQEEGCTVMAISSDASDYGQAETLCKQVVEAFGRIDILVNNAGITKDGLLLRMSEADWDAVINTNLKSVYNVTKPVSYNMFRNKSGSIINITSIVGMKGQGGQTNYAASKAGLIGFTKSLADELGGRNIRCNAIAPGFIETDMTDALDEARKKELLQAIPSKRLGSPDEVASAVLFLASDLSSYVNGQVISVCGGMNR